MEHAVEEVTLPCGTKGLLIDVPGSAVLNTKIYFRAGYQFGDSNKYEIPHLIEHHVLNATKSYPHNGQVWSEITRNGGYFNASTDSHFITYINECSADDVVRTIGLIGEILNNSLFPEANYLTERENVRSELSRNLTDYGRMAGNLLGEQTFPHLYLSYMTRTAQLDSIAHADVTRYYRATHTRNNASFVIAGAVRNKRALVMTALNNALQALPMGVQNSFTDQIGRRIEQPIVWSQDISPIYFNLSWFAGGGSLADRAALRLANVILTGGFGSRLFGKARDRGLAYHIGTGSSMNRFEGGESVRCFAERKNIVPLLDLIKDEFTALKSDPVSQTELQDAKTKVIGSIVVGTQTASAIAGWYAGDYLEFGDLDSYDDYFDAIRAVTPAQLRAQFSRVVDSKHHGACFVGKVDDKDAEQYMKQLNLIWK